jgi:hypothetical protein
LAVYPHAITGDLFHLSRLDVHPRNRETRTPPLSGCPTERDGYGAGKVLDYGCALEEGYFDPVSGAVLETAGSSDASRSGSDDGYACRGIPLTPGL